jgi:hypothetical protein
VILLNCAISSTMFMLSDAIPGIDQYLRKFKT